MNLVLLLAPTTLAVSGEAAMRHVRSTDQAETPDVEDLSRAAQEYVETRADRALTEQKWRLSLDAFPAYIQLPRSPLIEIESFTYVDADGVTQDVDDYELDADAEPAVIEPPYGGEWPTPRTVAGAVKITYRSGHTADRPAPQKAIQAIKLLIGHWYENREAVVTGTISTQVDLAVGSLLAASSIVAEFNQ